MPDATHELAEFEPLSEEDFLIASELTGDAIARADPSQLQEVAKFVGDISLYSAIGDFVRDQRKETYEHAEQFKTVRAERASVNMESKGFAVNAPRFADQVSDKTRKTVFVYNDMPTHHNPDGWPTYGATEHEGLNQLQGFLAEYTQDAERLGGNPFLVEQAQEMLENLTFIGDIEYKEAVRGIGQLWKDYLNSDPKHKICAIAGISGSLKYPGIRKSDNYTRDRILQTFTDEELEKYSGRIVPNIDALRGSPPEDVRVILVDDWAISGNQTRRLYNELMEDPFFTDYKKSIEVNLIASSKNHIEEGLQVDPGGMEAGFLKLRSYYVSHYGDSSTSENEGYVTGLHSTVNFDFEEIVEAIAIDRLKHGNPSVLPALASIVPRYRTQQSSIGLFQDRLWRAR